MYIEYEEKENNSIPDRDKCLELMDLYDMLPHIKDHSIVVCDVALAIARAVDNSGYEFNLHRITAASLLHDITKTRSIKTKERHGDTGEELLAQLGYKDVAVLVREHVVPDNVSRDVLSEGEIVCYADKRVLHDKVVCLHRRFEYLYRKYGRNERSTLRINTMEQRMRNIEEKIKRLLKERSVSGWESFLNLERF